MGKKRERRPTSEGLTTLRCDGPGWIVWSTAGGQKGIRLPGKQCRVRGARDRGVGLRSQEGCEVTTELMVEARTQLRRVREHLVASGNPGWGHRMVGLGADHDVVAPPGAGDRLRQTQPISLGP